MYMNYDTMSWKKRRVSEVSKYTHVLRMIQHTVTRSRGNYHKESSNMYIHVHDDKQSDRYTCTYSSCHKMLLFHLRSMPFAFLLNKRLRSIPFVFRCIPVLFCCVSISLYLHFITFVFCCVFIPLHLRSALYTYMYM